MDVPLKVVVENELSAYKKDSLMALGIKTADIVPLKDILGETVENLFQVQGVDRQRNVVPSDLVSPSAIALLGNRVRDALGISENVNTRRKLFASRGKNSRRNLHNEDAVFAALQQCGYEFVAPGELTYRDQVTIFSEATSVVGAHGAQLTNLIYSKGVGVLEIAPSSHGFRPDYLQICRATQSRWSMVGVEADSRDADFIAPELTAKWWLGQTSNDYDQFVSGDYIR